VGTLARPSEYDWTYAFFGPPESATHTANRSVEPFLHSSRQSIVGDIGATGWIRLNLWILAPPGEYDWTRALSGSAGLTRVYNPDGKSIGSAVFAQLTAESPYALKWAPIPPPKNCPFPCGDLHLHLTHCSLAHPSPQPKRHLDRFSLFCTDNGRVSLYFTMARPFHPASKLLLPMGDVDPHLIHNSLGPSESSTQTTSRSLQPFLHGSLQTDRRQTDRQTDHAPRSVTIGRIYVRSTAMRPNNNRCMNTYNNTNTCMAHRVRNCN